VDGTSGCDRNASIATDELNRPHFAYWSYTGWGDTWGPGLSYAYWDGDHLQHQYFITYSDYGFDTGYSPSLKLDANGSPHISHYDQLMWHILYTFKDGQEWKTQIVDSTTAEQLTDTVLVLDSQERPHIAYSTGGSGLLKYASFDGSNWNIEVIDEAATDVYRLGLALDSEEHPHIVYNAYAYGEYPDHLKLKYAHFDGTHWNIEDIDQPIEGKPSIAIDNMDRPHIAYYQEEGDDRNCPKYAYFNGSNWEKTEFQQYASGDYWANASLVVDKYNQPRIAFIGEGAIEYSNLQFAHWGNENGITLVSFTAQANDYDKILLHWQVATYEGSGYQAFNLYRRQLWAFPLQWKKINTEPVIMGSDRHFSLLDSNLARGYRYEYKLKAIFNDDSEVELGTATAQSGIITERFYIEDISPNPARGNFTFHLFTTFPTEATITIYDLSGKIVDVKKIDAQFGDNWIAMDGSHLAQGVYYLKARTKGFADVKTMVLLK
jgi:hypothetical protein